MISGSGKFEDVLSSVKKLLSGVEQLKPSPKNSASIVVLATIIGDYSLAATHLIDAVKDNVMGAAALRFYHYYTGDWHNVKPAIRILINRFKNMSTEPVITTDPERQELAYGIYGSPLRFEEGEMYSIDATVFKLIALETIADIMSVKDVEVGDEYKKAYEELKKNTENLLYNPKLGIYMNRHVEGEFSCMYGIGSMLAPLAGLTDDIEKLQNTILSLKSPKRFCAFTGVPTLPKNNYFFGRSFVNYNGQKADGYKSGSGMVSPIFNFLVYMGLKRYGVDDVAADIATKSFNAFKEEEKKDNYPSYYMPDWRESTSPKHFSIRAAYMAILPLIQAFSYDIFGNGLSISSVDFQGEITDCVFNLNTGKVVLSQEKTALFYDDIEKLSIPAKASIAYYAEDEDVSFCVAVDNDTTIELAYPLFKKSVEKSIKIDIQKGKSYVNVKRATGEALVVKFNG